MKPQLRGTRDQQTIDRQRNATSSAAVHSGNDYSADASGLGIAFRSFVTASLAADRTG